MSDTSFAQPRADDIERIVERAKDKDLLAALHDLAHMVVSVKQSAQVALASSGRALTKQWLGFERTAKQVKIPVKL